MSGIPDISIRRANPEDARSIARVHVVTWKATYAGIVDERILNGISFEASEQRQRGFLGDDRCLSFVAELPEQDGVIGFSVGGPTRKAIPGYDGELYALYVHPQFQGRGIGKELMVRLARSLGERGFARLMVWVLSENPARIFYEKMSGVVIAEDELDINGQTLRATAYGWESSSL